MVEYAQTEEEWTPIERSIQQTLHELLTLGIQTTRVEGRKLEGASDPVYGNVPAGLVGATFRNVLNELENLYQVASEDGKNILLPGAILEVIDKAQNPALFTRELIERASSENQFSNAGLESLREYHFLLIDKVKQEFPQLADALSEYQEQEEHSTSS